MEQTRIYTPSFQELAKSEVRCVYLEARTEDSPPTTDKATTNPTPLACSFCKTQFSDVSKQREHYKLDWHRYNLKQSLLGRDAVSEEQFAEKTDEVSSISGSDSEEKEETLDTIAMAQGKIFLESKSRVVFSMYKCLLFDRKEDVRNEVVQERFEALVAVKKICILMLGGGHFAGAIFEADKPILHKTFHCYTVRAGQGGAQSGRDSKSGSSFQPKSAGASLRRYNEQCLMQRVRDTIGAWREELEECGLIVYRAAGPFNRAVLFDGKPSLVERDDSRLRAVPFSTRRATFSEVKRVYELLTTVQIYDSLELATRHFSRNAERGRVKNANINRAKSRETAVRCLPVEEKPSSSSEEDAELLDNLDRLVTEDSELQVHEQEIDLRDSLQTFDDSLSPQQRKRIHSTKTRTAKKSKNKRAKEREEKRRKETGELIRSGNLKDLTEFLESYIRSNCETENDCETRLRIMNERLDENNNTLLHLASLHERKDMVSFLLENGADPCTKNAGQQTPYTVTQCKEIRDVFKQFAHDNPQRYNYNKAHIPLTTLTPEQAAEKKKQQRKVKREREKVKKEASEIKRKDEVEKERFLQLSDREKRALAAERRILNKSGAVISRCFLCGSDMSGKVPFEYLMNRFCSVDCVKAHRSQHATVLS